MSELRLADSEREEALRLLGDQYAVGRLTKDEFDERTDAVWSARTRGDLTPLFADLPVRPGRRQTARAVRPRRGSRGVPFPLVPVLFVLLGLALLVKAPFLLLVLAFWAFCARGLWLRRW